MSFAEIIKRIDDLVWGPAMLILLVGTGIFLTVYLKFLPWRNLSYAMRSALGKKARKKQKNGVSVFSSLMSASAATIGTGNIVGVATAMYAGGPGALVWMWISAFFGFSTKFSECMLAMKYRERNSRGEICGGPMYTIKNGFKHKKPAKVLAFLFALFAAAASFGIGNMTQANSVTAALNESFHINPWISGIIITILTFLIILGGIHSIARASDILVPVMAVVYILFSLIVIIGNWRTLPQGIAQIFVMAFDPKAVGGGIIGTITVSAANAVRYGVARGCFSNEAGMGSAAITAASAEENDPVRHGYIFMMDVFFDTIIICTMTGLVIASSGVLGTLGADGKPLKGISLVTGAFSTVLGRYGSTAVDIGIILFAFSTIIGWEYHGEKAVEYLFHNKKISIILYRILYSALVMAGSVTALETVWNISDIMNACMAIPNLISLIVLAPVIRKEVIRFQPVVEKEKNQWKEK